MRRRTFLSSTAAAAASALLKPQLAFGVQVSPDWGSLRRLVGSRLIDIDSPLVECARNHGLGANRLFAALKNPYYLSDEPSLTQTLG